MKDATHSYGTKDLRAALEHARDTMMALVRRQPVKDLDEQVSWINHLLEQTRQPPESSPVAWMRQWAYYRVKPEKVFDSETKRWKWPAQMKVLPVTTAKVFEDDVPLYAPHATHGEGS